MAYNVSEHYREIVYSGGALYDCHLYIDNTLVPIEQISSIKISSPIIDTSDETGKMFHIGTFISQKLDIKFRNLNGLNLSNNPEIELEIGMMVEGSYEYVPIGKYLIDDLGENYQTTCQITCLDYAVKFKSELDISQFFNQAGYIYASDLFYAICDYYGVTGGTIPNVNNNKQIYTYDSTITGKQYIMYLAELFGGNAKMDRNGTCNIIPLKNYTNIEIDALSSKKFEVGDTYELTRVCYDDGKLKLQAGGNVISVDTLPTTGISTSSYYYLIPEMKYYIYVNNNWQETTSMKNTLYLRVDNFFIRQQSEVDAIYNAVSGFTVTNINCENRMDLSLDCWDIVKYIVGNEFYYTFYDNIINYNGVTMGTDNTKIPLKLTEETTNIIEANTQAQIRNLRTTVNEQELSITTVIEEVGQQNAKISQVTQTVDELNSKIQENMDFTTSGESTYASVGLEAVNESNPITIKIHPLGENISYWYPHAGLFPSLNTLLRVRTLRFINLSEYVETSDSVYIGYKKYFSYDSQNDEYTLLVAGTDYIVGNVISGTIYENAFVDYELPDDLLYYDINNWDEFYYDITNETCQITKKCQYNADGTVSLLAEPIINTYEFPTITLLDGDYQVQILGYTTGYLFVRALTQNTYTSQFVTKAEHSSDITQTKDEINLSVDEKLTSYSTTTEMNSAIIVKANEITSTVASTYETKGNAEQNYSTINQSVNEVNIEVGKKYNTSDFTNAKITAKINDGSSSVKINADKIGLSANDVLNIIAGNTINLSSKNIAISSNNFNVNNNGDVIANSFSSSNANITGGQINIKVPAQYNNGFVLTDSSDVNQCVRMQPSLININGTNGAEAYLFAQGSISTSSSVDLYDSNGFATFSPGWIQNRPLYNNYTTSSSANLNIASDGTFYRSVNVSSKKYKKDIKDLEDKELDVHKLYDIPIKQFKYKEEIFNNKKDNRYNKDLIGFIAEEVAEIYPIAVDYENGKVENWNERYIIPAMLKLLQEQHQEIEQLKQEIKLLKEGK